MPVLRSATAISLFAAVALIATTAVAQPDQHGGHQGGNAQGHAGGPPQGRNAPARPSGGEPHPGPHGYQRVTPPQGWNARPNTVSRGAYQHNYLAARSYKIGPYHPPTANWRATRWTYGQILPRIYWGPQYLVGDYWLFGLEVPPVGCEWVRYGDDALLVDLATGEILQVEYGVFA